MADSDVPEPMTVDGDPVEFFMYMLDADGGEIVGQPVALGSQTANARNLAVSATVNVRPGDKFVIATDGEAESLATMRGRIYPAKTDAADVELFQTVEMSDVQNIDVPAWFTVGDGVVTGCGDDSYYLFLSYVASDWSDRTLSHHHLMLVPDEKDMRLMMRYEGETDFAPVETFNTDRCGRLAIWNDGVYSMRFTASEDGVAEFYWTYGNGRYMVHAASAQADKRPLISFDKDIEGLAFATSEGLNDQNGQSLAFSTPNKDNQERLVAGGAYEAVLDLNAIDRLLWWEHSVYMNHWLKGDWTYGYNTKVELQSHFTHQGTNEDVHIQGHIVQVKVKGVKPQPYEKWVWAYEFEVNFDLITPGTQNYFYFKVTTPEGKEYAVEPAVRQQSHVYEGYDNAIASTTFGNENVQFDYGAFKPEGKYTFFIEPETSYVWMQKSEGSVTGIDGIEADGDCEPEYFDLAGRRVAEPMHGVYVMRRGHETAKVVL